jgi:phospho-N-acetylmuramoyl-pentapeptide-transferase
MIYLLYQTLGPWLETHGLGFFRVFDYITFRAVCAIIFSFLFVILLGKPTIRWLLKMKIGDSPEFYHRDLNQLMKGKTNTPTMGGVLISGAICCSILLLGDLRSFYVAMALVCLFWLSILGLADDYLKLTTARRKPGAREGLHFWEKLVFQLGLAVVLGMFIHHHGQENDGELMKMAYSLTLPFFKSWQFDPQMQQYVPSTALIVLGRWSFVVLTVLVIAGSSNAVNLTDGMDGLACGIMGIVAFAFMVLAFIAGFDQGALAKWLLVPYIPMAEELTIVAAAMVGSCLGFLWYNCSPAQMFMGDTGALPLGGLIGYIAVVIRQEFLLLIIGGIFVFEALSVILQVGYFRLSGGKRIFKCAPVHHHFHLQGWTEQQVVVRFWLLSAILAAIALATIKLR